jgi:cytochrome c553
MLSLSGAAAKLGPYADAGARHQFQQSKFHRDVAFCGSCHDVSNPAVGDLAHNNGRQPTSGPVIASGLPGSPVDGKAAFNNFPYQYGVVERTFSEYASGLLSKTLVSNYATLPADLRAGAIKAGFDSAGGNYKDGSPRYFSCQTCHMRAVTGYGANKAGIPLRADLPLHDMTGGNYWMPDVIKYQNAQQTLRLGGGLTVTQISALDAGRDRARQQLNLAASLAVSGNTVKVTNLTGHKLISGYPEGRRMWLNVKWYDAGNVLIREDGEYAIVASVNGTPVKSIVDLDGANTKIYEAHYGMTQEWASQLLGLGYAASLPLSFDRVSGAVDYTLGNLAAQAPGTAHETFHFVLNNTVAKDNRIPPYGFAYDDARIRNALPVPAGQYGSPAPGGTYQYWDNVTLSPPAGAAYAQVRLLYQPTSWEYVQFLYLANTGQDPFLANEGVNLLNAWLNTGMAEPHVMASATWGTAPVPACSAPGTPGNLAAKPAKKAITLTWTAASPAASGGYRVYYSQAGKLQLRAGVTSATLTFKDTGLTSRVAYTYVVTAWNDCNGNGVFDAGIDLEGPPSGPVTATAQ